MSIPDKPRCPIAHARPSPRDEALVRADYEQRGDDFAFVRIDGSDLGYYVEPWTNECLMGDKLTPDQPPPISLDRSDEEISEDEDCVRDWIEATAHAIVVQDIGRRAPPEWILESHGYFSDWSELEFGASVMVFRIQPA